MTCYGSSEITIDLFQMEGKSAEHVSRSLISPRLISRALADVKKITLRNEPPLYEDTVMSVLLRHVSWIRIS